MLGVQILVLLSSVAAQSCSKLWSQCGGQGYTGPGCCDGTYCIPQNQWYSQCQPDPPTAASSTYPDPPATPTKLNVTTSSPTSQPTDLGTGYWSASGRDLVDAKGRKVRIGGVSWFGGETETYTFHGLWQVNYKNTLKSLVSLGYNTIRIPFSNDVVRGRNPSSINYGINPELQGKTAIEVIDTIIAYAGSLGLKVFLDRHRPDKNAQGPLWYADSCSEQQWIEDWVWLAKRYQRNTIVIGADLHNEPHDQACWGCGDVKLDWRLAAEKAGNAIHAVEPNWLIIVEGVSKVGNDNYWWGGNLINAGKFPVRLNVKNKLIYSTHEYSTNVANQPWFQDPSFPANMPAIYDKYWGYLLKQNIPVLVGEFGTTLGAQTDRPWLKTLVEYMRENGAHWTFWSWNPNSGDTGGILKDDWVSIQTEKDAFLAPIKLKLGAMI